MRPGGRSFLLFDSFAREEDRPDQRFINKNYPFYLIPEGKKIMQPAIGIEKATCSLAELGI